MALWTHNLPSGVLKNEFGEVDEAIFQGVERTCEHIFGIQGIKKKTTWTNLLK
jgi:hypothetical protein